LSDRPGGYVGQAVLESSVCLHVDLISHLNGRLPANGKTHLVFTAVVRIALSRTKDDDEDEYDCPDEQELVPTAQSYPPVIDQEPADKVNL
jgi:hypothetical protein